MVDKFFLYCSCCNNTGREVSPVLFYETIWYTYLNVDNRKNSLCTTVGHGFLVTSYSPFAWHNYTFFVFNSPVSIQYFICFYLNFDFVNNYNRKRMWMKFFVNKVSRLHYRLLMKRHIHYFKICCQKNQEHFVCWNMIHF